MVVDFLKYKPTVLSPLCIAGSQIERVSVYKLLGVKITNDLTWNEHCEYIYSKANKRLFGLRVLQKSGLRTDELLEVYCSTIRSAVEYASPVWAGLPSYLSDLLETIQKKALRIIFPYVSYCQARELAGLETLSSRRTVACKNFAKNCCQTGILSGLFKQPRKIDHRYNLRSGQSSLPSTGKTNRFNNFITVRHQSL